MYGIITCMANAETGITVTVNLETAGTLSTVLRNQGTDFAQISKIVVTGKLNNKDLNTISTSMPIVSSIDISGTNATVIPDDMFKGKSQIQEFIATSTIRKIGNAAFQGCYQLKTIPFSNQIDSIGNSAFSGCNNMIGTIVFPSTFSYLGGNAFSSCVLLSGIDLSTSIKITSLNSTTFNYCQGLKKVLLPASIHYFMWSEFSGCISLKSIDLSKCTYLTRLEGELFNHCSALDTILLPNSINYIGNVFNGCTSIKNITIMSKTPPQIESATFASVPYAYCKLNVPSGSEQTYQNATYWEYFDLVTGNGILPTIGNNGSLTANGVSLKNGEVFFHESKEIKLVPIPNSGYTVDSLTINDIRVTNLEDVVIPAGAISAKVKIAFKLKKFNLNVTVKGNGSIKFNNQLIQTSTTLALDSASIARFILQPDIDYVVDSLIFNDQTCVVQQDSIFNAPQINAHSTLFVSFISASTMGSVYKISVLTGANGYVKFRNTPLLTETEVSVKKDETASFTILPNATYVINQVLYNGLDVTNEVVDNVFTTEAVTGPSIFKVSFRINPTAIVTVNESGTLALSLTKDQIKEITKLKVSGYLNGYDFMFMRDSINNLSFIDLTDVNITEVAQSADWVKDYLPSGAFSSYSSLTQVLLPRGVKSINFSAFNSCSKLTTINLQDCISLTQILNNAFSNCTALTTVHLPSSLTSINADAFSNCPGLATITMDAVTPPTLDPGAFNGTPMTLIHVPDQSLAAYKAANIWKNYIVVSKNASPLTVNVATPGTLNAAIESKGVNVTDVSSLIVTGTLNSEDFRVMNKIMTQLNTVDLSQTTITEIPASAFEGKIQLLSFKAPTTIQSIGDKAFSGCRLLKDIPFGDKIRSIGANAFESCTLLDGKIFFPVSFISIGSSAFSGCTGLDSLDLGKCINLQQIAYYAFSGCTQLKSIEFPKSISSIGSNAFSSCYNLNKVDLSQCTLLTDLQWATFPYCNSLKEVYLPSSILSLSGYNFVGSTQLATVKLFSTSVPSLTDNDFSNVNLTTCVLYVPTGSAKSYGLASNWASFTTIKEMGIQTLVGTNGKILMDGKEFNNGQVIFHNEKSLNLTIDPNPGYEIDVLKFNKQAVSISGDTYTIPAGKISGTLEVSFKLKKFGLSVTIEGLGSLKYNNVLLSDTIISLPIDSASSAKFIVLANEGYLANQIQFNGLPNVVQKGDSIYNTPFITGVSTLSVHFAAKSDVGISHKVDVITGQNGYVEYVNTPLLPVTDVTIKNATSAVFTVKPNNGYLLYKVLYNGTDVTTKVVNNQYTISSVVATGKVEISFRVNPVFSLNVATPGNLKMLLSKDHLKGVTNLTLSGLLNAQDFMLMRDSMEVLSVLDIRQVTCSDYMQSNDPNTSVIPMSAFNTMTGGKKTLTDIYLPLNTFVIGYSAFGGCSNLRFVNFQECTKLSTILGSSFTNTSLKSIVMPASLKQLEQSFSNNTSLESVDLSATSLKTIPSYCFGSCNKLMSVSMPVTLETIESSAFQSCSALKTIDLSVCKSLSTIGATAFSYCYLLQTVSIPVSLKILGESAFTGCSVLKSIDLSGCTSLLSIEQNTFSSCNSLSSVKLPNTLQSIGVHAFYSCNIVGTIDLPATLKTIGNEAFFNNYRLFFCKIDATIPPVIGSSVFPTTMSAVFVPTESVVAYEAAAGWLDYEIVGGQKIVTVNVDQPGTLATCIMNQTGISPREVTGMTVTGDLNAVDFENIRINMQLLSSLDLSGSDVMIIPEGAFKDKTILMNFVAPDYLVEIKPHAFDNCSNLAVLNMPPSVMTIGQYAFNNCVSLNGVQFSKFLMSIGDYAFNGCSSMDQVLALPTRLKNIGNNAFSGCTSLKDTLFIPKGLETIGNYAFSNCNKISCVDMSTCVNIINIPSSLFSNCTSLSTVKLASIVRTISDQAFANCYKLTNIHYPTSLSAINSYAFTNCSSLKYVDLSGCKLLNSLGDEAFSNCTSLVTITLSPVLMNIGARAFSNNLLLANISSMNETPATLGENTFYRVKTKKCVLSIPKNAYNTYLNAAQWGSFVQMSKQVDVEIGSGGTISFESFNPDSILVNKPLANMARSKSFAATLSDSISETFGASLISGARICVLDNQVLKFNIVPNVGAGIKKVMYNNVDVTSSVVNGVFMTPSVTANTGTISVTFDGDIITDQDEKIESNLSTTIYCTSDVMYVNNENEMSGLDVYNTFGQLVYKSVERNTSYTIEGLKKGMYIVRVYLSNKTIETLKTQSK